MFEFHGWIRISCSENDDEDLDFTQSRQSKLCDEIQDKLHQIERQNCIIKLFRGVNGEDHLIITGSSNHFQKEVIDFMFWIAEMKTDSYGLLHIIDKDKICVDKSFGIRVWRLIKDEVIERIDPIFENEIDRMLNIIG